jgi:hypothetical protein
MELFFKIELKAESGRDREPGDGIIKHQVWFDFSKIGVNNYFTILFPLIFNYHN